MNLKAKDLLQLAIIVVAAVVAVVVFRFFVLTITLEITFHFSTYLFMIIPVAKATLRQVLYFCHRLILHFFIINCFHLTINLDKYAQLISVREHSAEVPKLLSKNLKSPKHLRNVLLVITQRILKHFWKKYCCLGFQHKNLVLIQEFYLKNDSQAFSSRNDYFFLISWHFIRIYIFIIFYY